jgi:hypothetical protein
MPSTRTSVRRRATWRRSSDVPILCALHGRFGSRRRRLDQELGGGGMSRLFLATDLALDRQVVVKVLSAELSAGVSGARFRREIQLPWSK